MPVVLSKGSVASITDLHAECLVYDQYLLTKRGSLIGGLVVEGRDGDGPFCVCVGHGGQE